MRITILLFAQLADAVGARSIDLEVSNDATVAQLLDALEASHPSITPFRGRVAVAIDERYVTPDAVVQPAQTIALIPPVSGG